MNDIEVRLGRALAETPDLPEHLYGRIGKAVARNAAMRHGVWAAVASLLIVLGAVTYHLQTHPQSTVSGELQDELQLISSFVNGSDIDDDLAILTSADEEILK